MLLHVSGTNKTSPNGIKCHPRGPPLCVVTQRSAPFVTRNPPRNKE